MIVADDTVSKALAYLSDDPHPLALARKDVADAENKCKATFARLFLSSSGSSVAAKEAEATCHPEYVGAKAQEAEAIMEQERHRARARAAEMIVEVWRSENANARAAEKMR